MKHDLIPLPGGQPPVDSFAEREAKAMNDHREGRSHSHAVVSKWLMTWGKPGRKPFHQWLADQDG